MVDPGNQDDAARDRPRDTDTTLHLTTDFEAQLAALEGEVSPEEKSSIAALPSGSALLVVRRGPNTGDGAEVQVGKFRLTFYASRLDLVHQASK